MSAIEAFRSELKGFTMKNLTIAAVLASVAAAAVTAYVQQAQTAKPTTRSLHGDAVRERYIAGIEDDAERLSALESYNASRTRRRLAAFADPGYALQSRPARKPRAGDTTRRRYEAQQAAKARQA